MSRMLIVSSLMLILFPCFQAQANDNPIRKSYPFSIVEVLVDKPKDENATTAKPLPLDKIPFKQRTDKYMSIGTAWFSSQKQLFSAAHVFSPESMPYTTNFYVRNIQGEVFPVDAVTAYSNKYDVIAFTLKFYPTKIVPIQVNKNFAIGDDVCAPGNALGEGISLRCGGQISSLNPEPQNGEWKEVYFSTPVSPGNSGGPLLDSNGKAIGIIVRKIKGEDLNIAMPFNEMKKVKAKLEFFAKGQGFQDSGITALNARQDFRTSSNQPMPVMAWLKLIVDDLDAHMLKMSKLYNSIWAKNSILTDKNAKDYFINPAKPAYFSRIKFMAGNNGVEADSGNFKEIKNLKRPLFLQNIGESFFLFVENIKGDKAGSLLEKPKEVMDTILATGLFMKRQIADEEILYTSLGEPYASAPVLDLLGRNWTLYRWSIKEIQTDLSLFCTARPSGVACLLDPSAAMMSNETMASTFQLNAAELTLGYYGTSRQWTEYLALPASIKPKFMQNLKITTVDSRISLAGDDLSFIAPLGTKDKDDIVLLYSYDVQKPLTPTLFTASYYPNAKENLLLTTTKVYRGKTADDKKSFASLNNSEKPFDGNIYEKKDGQFISSEVVAKIGGNCLILGFTASDTEKKLEKFKRSVSFDEDDADQDLAH